MIHIALVPGAGGKLQPRVLTLRQILDQYIGFQKDVVERRTRFDLKKARDRAHILEGLKVATDNIDRIIAIIRASKNEAEAKENLMGRRSSRNTATSAIRALRMWLTRSTLRTSSSSRTARTPSPTSAISSASRPRFTAHSAAVAAVFPQ